MVVTESEIDPLLTAGATGRQTYASTFGPALDSSSPRNKLLNVKNTPDHFVVRKTQDPRGNRQLGVFSLVLLVFNRIVGTSIYATPSIILRLSGSVGVSLLMWLVGALIAAVGTTVYIEIGTGLPRSGGEKNFLEFVYRRPKFMVVCIFAVYAPITGSAAANSMVFGEYVVHVLSLTPSERNTLFIAFLSLTFCLLVHGVTRNAGLLIQNILGVLKLVVLCAIALSGFFCLAGITGISVRDEYEKPTNFEWDKLWEGSGTGANTFVTGLYNVIWSFMGYSGVTYALSEVKDPIRTVKRAAPLAMFLVTMSYILVNIAYFAVISKADILGSGWTVAATFFRNLYGHTAEKVLSGFVALSVLGNLLAYQFIQGRIVQELGRGGVLPYASFFASNKPFDAPLAALFMQYVVSCVFLVAPPPGDAYLFMVNLAMYSFAIVNILVAFGLLLVRASAFQKWNWNPPFRASKPVVVLFFLVNVFLILIPFIPPSHGSGAYERLPYWSHILVAYLVSLLGIAYWFIRCVWLPKRNGYRFKQIWMMQDDGISRYVLHKVPTD